MNCAHNSEDAKRVIFGELMPHVLWPVYDFPSVSSFCGRGGAFTSGFYYHPPRRSPGGRFVCSGKNSLKLLTTYYLLLTTYYLLLTTYYLLLTAYCLLLTTYYLLLTTYHLLLTTCYLLLTTYYLLLTTYYLLLTT